MFVPHYEGGRQQSEERTVLPDGTILKEISWAAPNRASASTEDLMLSIAKSVKKGLESRLRPSSGGMTVEVSDEGRAQAIPVESMADAYMSAAGDSKARAAAVAKLVRQTMGLAE